MDVLGRLIERPSGPTRLSRLCNLSYDKCAEILAELEARGLVRKETEDGHDVYSVTPDGYKLTEDWRKIWEKVYPDSSKMSRPFMP